MSTSLALLPLALALRIAMGKENFQQWLAASQIRVPTTFETEMDLVRTIKQAGYDAEKRGGVRKTHVGDRQHYFVWELIDGRWVAVFARVDAGTMMPRIMDELEQKSGRRLFDRSGQGVEVSPSEQTHLYPTNFRDASLLIQTLQAFGAAPEQQPDGSLSCTLGATRLRFVPAEGGPYSVEVGSVPNLQLFQELAAVDGDYKRSVQSAVYDGLKNRIEEKHLVIESEEVMEDDSILITLTVPG